MSKPPKPPTQSVGDNEVGYGKPPVHSRFKPGQSGNPRGRRKGALNVKTEIEELVNQPLSVAVKGGKVVKMSSFKAMLVKNYQKALGGDARAFEKFMALVERYRIGLPEVQVEDTALDEDDEAILAEFLRKQGSRDDRGGDDDLGTAA